MIIKRFLCRLVRTTCLLGLLCLAGLAQAKEQTLLVLGDSISAAYGMSLDKGWVSLLQQQLAQTHPEVQVINSSISGETTDGALRRLPALLELHLPSIVVIELGGNDGLRGFPIKSFRDNLSQLARQSTSAGARVVIVQMEIPPNYGSRYTSAFRDSYPLVASDTGSILGPFLLDGIATDPALMQSDGIHPKPEAQAAMLQNIMPTLLDTLE